MPTQPLTFMGSDGARLAARLELPPDRRPDAWAVFAHCFTCSKNSRAAVDVTRGLCAEGIAVLRFDFTGLGESEGDFSETDFSSNVEDVVRAAEFLSEDGHEPSLLVGHSLGGAAVVHAASRIDSVRAVVTIGAPADPSHVLRHLRGRIDQIEREGAAMVEIGGRSFKVKKGFLDDLEETRTRATLQELDRALLIMHSPTDRIVGVDNAAALYEMARHPKSFISLDGADHLLSSPEDSLYAARVLSAWAGRYVERRPAERHEDELVAEDRVVARTGPKGYRTDIRVRRHALVADEPESVGGSDAGPTPYDFVVSGLGACTSMTLRMYADRKEWPLDEIRVRLKHRKIHTRDREATDAGDGESYLDEIDREIELHGDLTEEQRARLMEIADRCPVHRTLEAGVKVSSRQVPPGDEEVP